MKTYYIEQLERVKPGTTEYSPTFKIFANTNGDDTKHISLNLDSAQVLIEWLTTNYLKCTYIDSSEIKQYIKKKEVFAEHKDLKDVSFKINDFTTIKLNKLIKSGEYKYFIEK